MQFLKRPQFIAIASAVFIIVLLLLLPRVYRNDEAVDADSGEVQVPETGQALALSGLSAQDKALYDLIRNGIENSPGPIESIEWRDSLSKFWEERNELVPSADELFGIAEIVGDKASYFIAADAYFRAFREGKEETRKEAIGKSISTYNKVLEENPADLEAKTSLAVCYVEGAALTGEAPMKGIAMLKEVLEADPENVNALVNLGYFAIRSGQFETAIERFNRVLEIDPEFPDAYLYLADIYIQLGDKEKAIGFLEQYRRFIEDPAALKQFEEYIESIKQNNI